MVHHVAAKFEFKSPSVHSVVCGHPTAKSEFRHAEIHSPSAGPYCTQLGELAKDNKKDKRKKDHLVTSLLTEPIISQRTGTRLETFLMDEVKS
ncbi:hypothetical protein E2C01_009564 [Portunus trituberculatus]|uniref:Uncharacterized protein n=1 Tax=Portunus trituberculatus TaxID=210409 RepID=A0A5B7D643_PORTR|nr:hypothetical protein [Portunus trituberculatus]